MISEADTCRKYVLPKLYAVGWTGDKISEQKYFTDGRIVAIEGKHVRRPGKKADYLLKLKSDKLIAVVEAKAAYKKPDDGMQQAIEYAQILDLKFAYSTNGKGIEEYDFTTGKQKSINEFPSLEELWHRLRKYEGLEDYKDVEDYLFPFNRELRNPDGSIKVPRYYQKIAIDRAVKAVIQGKKRILLTMATGAGKTLVAFQIIWKLWKTKRKKRILYLADRNVLADQAKDKTFTPFGDARWKIQQKPNKSREIYFALYQALSGDTVREDLYKKYPRDFFDLVIVDECHRGSARNASSWRRILEYFSSATQIGMTATPKRNDNVDTYRYFSNPIYVYTLEQGINDGYLAPYRVHRVIIDIDAVGWRPTKRQLDRYRREIPDRIYGTKDFERVVSILSRTKATAKHLTNFLKITNRMDKTIVFCVGQEHAAQMKKELSNFNSDITKNHPDYCVRIVALEGHTGRKHLDNFQDPETGYPVIATTSQMLTTGVDAPTCKNIVLFKPINSIVDFKQIIGRGTRIYSDKDKLWFNIIDYTGATRLFADPEFDGVPEFISEEEINTEGEVTEFREIENHEEKEVPIKPIISDDSEGETRKYYVDGVNVEIVKDIVSEIDVHGKKLRIIRLEDYTKEQVRKLYPNAKKLRQIWLDPKRRKAFVEELEQRGISFEKLLTESKHLDADPFDLLVHIAYNSPLKTRRERANRVRKEEREFFKKYSPHAREILEVLLDMYTDYGYKQLDDMNVLRVPNISKYGTPVQIAKLFGGVDVLRGTLSRLQNLVYSGV